MLQIQKKFRNWYNGSVASQINGPIDWYESLAQSIPKFLFLCVCVCVCLRTPLYLRFPYVCKNEAARIDKEIQTEEENRRKESRTQREIKKPERERENKRRKEGRKEGKKEGKKEGRK